MTREKFLTASAFLPAKPTLRTLKQAASECKGCDLWKRATQTVFGEGPSRAAVMFVGEQPGDKEDLAGKPFVGPAGRIFDEAIEEAGIDRSTAYVTNAVKHFSWTADERGKRRIHQKPRYSEVQACRPWIEAEIAVTKPRVIVCLGATAAQALLGKDFSVTRQRGVLMTSDLAPKIMATVHPSSILRARDEKSRHEEKRAFVRDLMVAAREIGELSRTA